MRPAYVRRIYRPAENRGAVSAHGYGPEKHQLLHRHGVDLDQRAHRKRRHLIAHAGGHPLGKEPGVNGVHRGEIADVLQQDGGLNHVAERIAALFEDVAQVRKRPVRLGFDAILPVAPSIGSWPET